MVARCCLLVFLAAARGIWWVLEQPRGSLLQYHPAFQLLSSMLKVYRKHIKMGNFGSLTEKGTWLYSGPSLNYSNSKPTLVISQMHLSIHMSHPTVAVRCHYSLSALGPKQACCHKGHGDIDGIDDFQPRNLPSTGDKVNLVDVYYDKKGIRRVKGNGQLKRSQAYPKQFFGLVSFVSVGDCTCKAYRPNPQEPACSIPCLAGIPLKCSKLPQNTAVSPQCFERVWMAFLGDKCKWKIITSTMAQVWQSIGKAPHSLHEGHQAERCQIPEECHGAC